MKVTVLGDAGEQTFDSCVNEESALFFLLYIVATLVMFMLHSISLTKKLGVFMF
jgi:hypothetical protein